MGKAPTMITEIVMVLEDTVAKYRPRWLSDKALRNARRLEEIDRALIWFANTPAVRLEQHGIIMRVTYFVNGKRMELGSGNSLIDALLDAYKKKEELGWSDYNFVPAAQEELKIVDMTNYKPPQKRKVKI